MSEDHVFKQYVNFMSYYVTSNLYWGVTETRGLQSKN